MDRVKCYDKTDLAYHMFDTRIKILISNLDINTIIDYIEYNQIIELYEANNEYLEEITSKVIKNIKGSIYRKVNADYLESEEWINKVLENTSEYTIDDLINFIVRFKRDLLDDNFIEEVLTRDNIGYANVLNVKEFQEYIQKNFLKVINIDNIKFLEALTLKVVRDGSLYSEKINEENTSKLIECYVNQECNLNYLPDIFNSKNKKINAKIRVMAMNKYNELLGQFFTEENSVTREFDFRILWGEDTTNLFKDDNKDCEHWNFDKEILKYGALNSYYAVYKFLLNDFGIFEMNKISVAHYSQDNFKGISSIAYTGYKTYQSHNHMFRAAQQLQLMRMSIFIDYLKKKNINIYKLLNYVIEQILKNGFYTINDSENYYDYSLSGINKHLCIQIESLLSQYISLKKYDIIRSDYISLDANTLDVKQIHSISTRNYYVKDMTYFKLMDSQSRFSRPIDKEYSKNLYEQIKENRITKNTYKTLKEYHLVIIDLLIENNILVWENEVVVFAQKKQLPYWEILFETGVISLSVESSKMLEEMVVNDLLLTDSKLFDKFEIEYFNFIFNNQSFNDGLAIRNKYLHTGHVDMCENEVNMMLIKLLLEVIMKIHYTLYSSKIQNKKEDK